MPEDDPCRGCLPSPAICCATNDGPRGGGRSFLPGLQARGRTLTQVSRPRPRKRFSRCAGKPRPDDQEILKLVASWDGLSPSQAAVVLGCSPLAARTRLHRARNRLAKRLGFERGVQRSSMARQILRAEGDVCPVPEVTDG